MRSLSGTFGCGYTIQLLKFVSYGVATIFFSTTVPFVAPALCQNYSAGNHSADSINRKKYDPPGFFELSCGLVLRSARRMNEADPSLFRTNRAIGVSGKMQSSILGALNATKIRRRRFTWGDVLAAEVFAGNLSTDMQHETGKTWLAYYFDFGFGGRMTINEHSEAGLNLLLLKFSRDNVSGNISGSGISGRYRNNRFVVEAGVVARHERAFGLVIDVRDKIPLQQTYTLRYLLRPGKNFGFTAESLRGPYHQDGYQYSNILSLKIFYGLYF